MFYQKGIFIFTIPSKGKWTLIFNKQWKQWGAYSYDQSEDQLRITFCQAGWMKIKKIKIYFTNDELLFGGIYKTGYPL